MNIVRLWRNAVAAVCAGAAAVALGVVAPAAAMASGVAGPAAVPPGGQLWASTFDGSGQQDFAGAVAASPDGRMVFVAGATDVSPSGTDFATVGYDAATGAQKWVSFYPGMGGENGAGSVAVSPDGATVFATGSSSNMASGFDFATVAYSATSGRQLWARRWKGASGSRSFAAAITLGAGGQAVLVTGTNVSGAGSEFAVTIAYNAATGARLWVRKHRGSDAEAMAISPAGGTVYITGSNGIDFSTIAYAVPSGARTWVSRYRAQTTGRQDGAVRARSVAVGPGGRTVYITGTAGNAHVGRAHDYATVAYRAATGTQLWARRYNGTGGGDDEAHSVTVGPGGRTVYVTGASIGTNALFDFATVAYNAATGGRLWVARYNDPAGHDDAAWVVRAAPGGRTVYVTGAYLPLVGSNSATIAYNAATGAVRWIAVDDGLGMDSPQGMALAPDGSALYVAGNNTEPEDKLEFFTVAHKT